MARYVFVCLFLFLLWISASLFWVIMIYRSNYNLNDFRLTGQMKENKSTDMKKYIYPHWLLLQIFILWHKWVKQAHFYTHSYTLCIPHSLNLPVRNTRWKQTCILSANAIPPSKIWTTFICSLTWLEPPRTNNIVILVLQVSRDIIKCAIRSIVAN
jgi:hypothetical protein